MQFHSKLLKLGTPLAMTAVAALTTVSPAGAAQAATSVPASESLASQIAAVYDSPTGVQVRKGIAESFTDPALPTAAAYLLNTYGPTGTNVLSAFQVDLLNALITETDSASLISTEYYGKPLNPAQQAQAGELQAQLMKNPAVTAIIAAGAQLATSPDLTADIDAAAKVSVTTGSPMPTHIPAIDTVVDGYAKLENSASFKTFAGNLSPLILNAGFPALLRTEGSVMVAGFLPAASLIGLTVAGPAPAGPAPAEVKSLLELAAGTMLSGLGANSVATGSASTTRLSISNKGSRGNGNLAHLIWRIVRVIGDFFFC